MLYIVKPSSRLISHLSIISEEDLGCEVIFECRLHQIRDKVKKLLKKQDKKLLSRGIVYVSWIESDSYRSLQFSTSQNKMVKLWIVWLLFNVSHLGVI